MHEMSMAENILEIIGHYVPEHQQPQVRAVKMRVGEDGRVEVLDNGKGLVPDLGNLRFIR